MFLSHSLLHFIKKYFWKSWFKLSDCNLEIKFYIDYNYKALNDNMGVVHHQGQIPNETLINDSL